MMPKGGKKPRNKQCICRHCGSGFLAADVKASVCPQCHGRTCPCGCGQRLTNYLARYAQGHSPAQNSPEAHAKQAAAISGERNPAKRSEVRAAISSAVKENHPSRTHPDLWMRLVEHMRRASPPKISLLETRVAPSLVGYQQQYPIGPYICDFARPETMEVVEVHGCWWHVCPTCFPDGPTCRKQTLAVANDKRRLEALPKLGWKVSVVWGCRIEQFIGRTA